jgi:hypothetical protein
MQRNYGRVLYWWTDVPDSLIQRVTTLYFSLLHTHTHTHYCPKSRLKCLCLVSAFNSGLSPSNVGSQPIPGLSYKLSQQQLTTEQRVESVCLRRRYLANAVLLPLILMFLRSNGSTCHIIIMAKISVFLKQITYMEKEADRTTVDQN